MKKYIISISCLIIALCFMSCNGYLDIVPKGKSALNKTDDYLGLLEDMYGYPINSEWYICGEATSYNMTLIKNYTYPLVSAGFFWDESFDRTSYMVETGSSSIYSMCYNKIAKYNIIIQNINDSDGDSDDKTMGMAQAKILRAYNYFYLINTFAKPYAVHVVNDVVARLKVVIAYDSFGVPVSLFSDFSASRPDIHDPRSKFSDRPDTHGPRNRFSCRPDKLCR